MAFSSHCDYGNTIYPAETFSVQALFSKGWRFAQDPNSCTTVPIFEPPSAAARPAYKRDMYTFAI